MKQTLLSIVKDILNDTDGEDVNSISESVEALQIANVVKSTFNDLIATREIPEHGSLIKLTSLSDSNFPTHFVLEDEQSKITDIWYDVSSDNTYEYRKLKYLDQIDFLLMVDKRSVNYVNVDDKSAGSNLRIINNRSPHYYTTFDDKHIVLDSFDAAVDTTLQHRKIRALGNSFPAFYVSDEYVPDIDANMFPYLIQESKSRAFSLFKGQVDQKIEQSARRQKVYIQNDKRRISSSTNRRDYGRR